MLLNTGVLLIMCHVLQQFVFYFCYIEDSQTLSICVDQIASFGAEVHCVILNLHCFH